MLYIYKTLINPVDGWKSQFDKLHYMIPLIWLPTSAILFQILVHRSSRKIIRGKIAGIIFGIIMIIIGTWLFFATDVIFYGASCCSLYVSLPTEFWTFSMAIIQIGIMSISSKINLWPSKKNKVKHRYKKVN